MKRGALNGSYDIGEGALLLGEADLGTAGGWDGGGGGGGEGGTVRERERISQTRTASPHVTSRRLSCDTTS